jgi:hypothetical protein
MPHAVLCVGDNTAGYDDIPARRRLPSGLLAGVSPAVSQLGVARGCRVSAALWRVAGVPLGRVAPGVVDVPLVRVARLSGCERM